MRVICKILPIHNDREDEGNDDEVEHMRSVEVELKHFVSEPLDQCLAQTCQHSVARMGRCTASL